VAAVVVVGGVALAGVGVLRFGQAAPTVEGPAPHFVDETASSGVSQTYRGGPAYDEGGGIAAFDCTGDGLPELYIAGGTAPARLLINTSKRGGALTFTERPDPVLDQTGVEGAYPLDVDGDGITDLAVLTVHGLHLLRGTGQCGFVNADASWRLDGGSGWTTAFSAMWEGAAAFPTLAVGRYQQLDATGSPTFTCDTSSLLRPAAAGTTYASPITLAPGYCALSMLFSDWDRSGRRDLRITNDRHYYVDGSDQLWRIAAGQPPHAYTPDEGWIPLQVNGMGIASYDLTGDGYPEYYLTSQGDNRLQTLTSGPSQPTYRDIALKRGVNTAQPFTGGDVLPSTSWHPEFTDVNNDGFVDLFVSKGNVNADPNFAARDPSDLFLGRPDGTFSQAADVAGILSYDRARGAAVVDLNGDGLPDLVVVNLDAPVRVWRNEGASGSSAEGHWLDVALRQPAPNRDAVGAWIEVRSGDWVQRREVTVGGGHLSGALAPAHFGLGPVDSVDVRVEWPDGTWGPWQRAAADEVVIVDRGSGTITASPTAGP
jgi:hypothetical protein